MLFTNSLLLVSLITLVVTTVVASAGSMSSSQQFQPITNIQFNRQQQPNQATNPIHHISILPPHAQPSQVTAITIQQTNSLNNPYTLASHALLLDLRAQLINRAMKFDEHFRSLLSSSKISLHNMFADTYGLIYQQNSEIFTSMYESLEQYYATGQINLTKSMQDFFVKLYQKIFQASNMNRVFTAEYMACTTEQLEHLKPFKDAPEKLISEIRHAFVAARTFNQALNSGIDVIKSIISLGQPQQCTRLINERLLKPNGGSPNALVPCLGYCEQVISRCIGSSNLDQLNERWRAYVMSISELAKKLSVHYNIETIIAPLDVQISEAIMNFQENASNITEQVSRACGPSSGLSSSSGMVGQHSHKAQLDFKPNMQPNRLGRRAAPAPISVARSGSSHRIRHGPNSFHAEASSVDDSSWTLEGGQPQMTRTRISNGRSNPSLEEPSSMLGHLSSPIGLSPLIANSKRRLIVIDEIKDFMLSTKQFWANLPNSVCTSNGSSSSSMLLGANAAQQKVVLSRKSPQCFEEHLGISDMNSDLRYRTEIQQQVLRLNLIQVKIGDALRGVEIDWTNGHNAQQSSAATVVSNSQQRPTSVTLPSPSPTASTSGEDETEDEDDQIEPGSGDGSGSKNDPDSTSIAGNSDDSTTPDDSDYQDGVDPGLDAAPGNDDDDYTSSSANNNSDNDDTTTQQPNSDFNNEQSIPTPDNSLDSLAGQPPKMPTNLDISNELITAPDAQKSGASGSHMELACVISSFNQLFNMLLPLLLSLISTTVTYHQYNFIR